jgi:hypothetical protein
VEAITDRLDEFDVYFTQNNQPTLSKTYLEDLEKWVKDGTFCPGVVPEYKDLATLIFYMSIGDKVCNIPIGRPLEINPDCCYSVRKLKDYIEVHSLKTCHKPIVADGAILTVWDQPGASTGKWVKFSIEDNDIWLQWKDRNLVFGRLHRLPIYVLLDPQQPRRSEGRIEPEREVDL